MQNNNELLSVPHIFKNAFQYWKKTLIYQIIYALIYGGIFLGFLYFFAMKFSILSDYLEILENTKGNITELEKEITTLSKTDNYQNLIMIMLGVSIFLSPLQIGFLKIYRKIDTQEPYTFADLFSGYSGINFFIYLSYFTFWNFSASLLSMIYLSPLWIIFTIFVVPVMFFTGQGSFSAMKFSFLAVRKNFWIILVTLIGSFIIKYSGLILFGIGFILTSSFPIAVLYTLYNKLFSEIKR